MSQTAQLIPVRQLLSALAAAGLGWSAQDAWSHILAHPDLAPYVQHQNWMVVQFLCIVTGLATLSALTPRERRSHTSPTSLLAVRKLAGQVRRGLFVMTVLLLEVALLATFSTLIWFSIVDGAPTIRWGRVGGVVTDWVIDLFLILPLLLGLAVFNLFLLSSDSPSDTP